MAMGKLVFAQIMEHLPLTTFHRCEARYGGEHKVKTLSCLDQYLCMAFAQLTYRESLRDIEACLGGTHPTSAVLCEAWYFAKRVTLSVTLRRGPPSGRQPCPR
jgi:hypothetical protein